MARATKSTGRKQAGRGRNVLDRAVDTVSNSVSPTWQLQTAKAKFSEVFRRARMEGPQRITRQGKEGIIMISEEEYRQMSARSRQPKSLVEFFRRSPLAGIDLDLEREKDPGRDIQL